MYYEFQTMLEGGGGVYVCGGGGGRGEGVCL